MKEYFILIKPLTPIWTGDAEGRITTLKETGIIGSLRWWYETLIRGLGGTACDITSDNPKERCDYERDKGKICNTCELFGCTGWGRKFKLEASPVNYIEELNIGTRKKLRDGRERYLRRKIRGFISENPVTLTITPLRGITKSEWALLNKTFKIIEEHGALGAHSSQGNGVIKILQNSLPGQESSIDTKNFISGDTSYPKKENLETEIRKNLFSDSSKEYLLKECRLKEEKNRKEVMEGLI